MVRCFENRSQISRFTVALMHSWVFINTEESSKEELQWKRRATSKVYNSLLAFIIMLT